MIKSEIIDGKGTGDGAWIKDHALLVTQHTCPPLLPQKNKIFQQYLTVDGTSSGSNDMGIDGSGTAVKFYIKADSDNDKYISRINLLVGYGASAPPYNWVDSGGVLTNGFRFYYERSGEEVDIHPAIKKNSDLIRIGVKDIMPTAWEVRNLGASNDYGYLVTANFIDLMPPFGIKLDAGTTQRIVFQVRDDNTDADTMNAVAYGFERFE